ncbi:MAG: metal-dependent transcriptional regulator [Candidatus Heimdallarchaeota archaeon]
MACSSRLLIGELIAKMFFERLKDIEKSLAITMTQSFLTTRDEEILESLLYLQMKRTTTLGREYSNEIIPVAELVQRLEQSCADPSTHSATLNIITRKLASDKEAEDPWIEFKPHVGVCFTDKGLFYAKGILRKHRLAERLLVELLDFPIEEAHDEACRLEHAISNQVADQIEMKIGDEGPLYCPHGVPIPSKDGNLPRTQFKVLSDLEAPRIVVLRGSMNEESSFLKDLRELGLLAGTKLQLTRSNLESGNINLTLQVDNRVKEIVLPQAIASSLLVEPLE